MKQVLFFLSLFWSVLAVGQSVPSDQIIGHYPFNGNAINVLNSNLNGTVTSGVTLGTDRFGHANAAYVFPGSLSETIAINNSLSAFNVLPLSMSFWFKTEKNDGVLISNYQDGSYQGFRASLYDRKGGCQMNVWYLNANNSDYFSAIPITLNTWHHCVVNFEAGKTSLYLDGVFVASDGSTTVSTPAAACTAKQTLRFGENFKGSMDDIRFYKRALTLAEITNLANSTGVAAYYPFSGNAKDASGNQLDGTLPATGVTATTDAWGKANSAYSFNGTGMITTPLRQIAVTQYTVSAWVKMNSGEYGTIVSNTGGKSYSNATSVTTSDVGVCFGVDDDGKLRFGVVGQYIFRGVKSTKTVNDGQWHHVVAVLDCPTNTTLADGNSCTGVFKTYVDGIDCAGYDNGGGTAKAPFTGVGYTAIGEMDGVIGVPTAKAKGIIDEVRISNEALTANEVTALYLQNTASRGLLLYYPLDGNTKDSSGNGLDGSIKSYQGYNVTTSSSGVNLTKNRFGIANSAYLFNTYLSNTSVVGSIDRPTDAKLDFKNTDCLSFSCWLNLTSFAGMDGNPRYSTDGCQTLFAKDGDEGVLKYNYTTKRIQFQLPSTTTETVTPIDDSYLPKLVGQWNHIALSVTPTSKKIYVNGKLVWTATGTYDLSKMNGKGIAFGHSYGSYWYPLNGSLDDIRLFNRALTQDEVSVLATNTLLLSKTSETTATTATIPNTFPASNTFTVEMWVKPNTLAPSFQLFMGCDGGYKVPTLFVQGTGLHYNLAGGIANTTIGNIFTAGQWTHIAWANENGIAKIYKNGVLVTTKDNIGIVRPKDSVDKIILSVPGSWAFDGQLDEVRIWSTARTAAQIQANLNKELSVASQTGLTASYSFNGTMANTTINSIGSINTAAYAYTSEAFRTPALRACTGVSATGFTVNWCPLPGAFGYQLQYASDAAFTTPTTITAAASDSLKAITGLTAGVYYVRIRAQIPLTVTTYGNWSDAITVSTPFSSPGKGVSLNGDARYVQVPSGNWFNGNTTVEGWVYLNDKQVAWSRFFDFSNGANVDNVIFSFNGMAASPGMPVITINSASAGVSQYPTTDSVRLKTWTHVAVTFQGATVTVYFNGKVVLKKTDMKIASNVVRNQNYIGKSPWSDVEQPNAIFDEFRIYNTVLTQNQIIKNAHTHLASTEPNLVLYYDFDNVNGVVPDLSATKADGIVVNTPAFANSQALLTPFTVTATNNQANNSFTATWDNVQNPSFELQYALDTTFILGLSKTYTATTNTLTVNVLTDWSKVFYRVRYKNGQDSSVWVSNSIKLAQTPPAVALSLNNTSATKNLSVDKYLSVPLSTWFNGNFTVDAWVNPSSLQTDVRLFDFGTGGASNSVLMACGQYVKFTTATGTDAAVITIPSVPISQWTHVALTYNATTKVAAVYYNGVWVAGAVVTTGPTAISRTSNFIGASNTGNPSSDMLIDEFRIYNEVLVTDTIIARSHRHLKGTESNLVLYYDFDNVTSASVTDLSTTKANGTLYNTPALANSQALLTPFVRVATAISQTGFTANWDAVPSAAKYQVQYTSAGTFGTETVKEVTATTANVFSGLTAGSSYQYRVRAISNRDTSEWSARKITLPVPAPGNTLSLDNTSTTKDLTKDKYVAVPSGKWLNGSFTVDAWVYRRTAKANDRFFDFGNGAGADNVLFSLAGGYVIFISPTPTNPINVNLLTINGLPSIPFKQWNHIALTLDSLSSTAKVYYNGVLVGTGILSSKRLAANRSSNYIGASNYGDATSDMLIDEFRISNRALSATEIAERMHKHLLGTETDLQLYYDFDYIEGDGQTVADLTGKKQNGMLMNTPSYAASKALLTPFTISANDVTTAGFTASCENIAVATGYDFQYVAQGKTDSLTVSATANTGIISGLQAATTYSYRVRSKTAAITGEWSKSATVTLPANAPANALQCNTTDKASGTLKTALGTAFTVECWVAPSAASFDGQYRAILGSQTTNRLFPTMWIWGTTLRVEGYSAAQKVYDIKNFFNKNEADAWVHIAWVQDGSTCSVYRNGQLVGSSSDFIASNFTSKDFTLGSVDANLLSGKLDEVRFWNKALTQKDIKAGLHKHLAGTDANLVAYYDFDYKNANIISDLSVNKQNAKTTLTTIYSASKALLTPFIRAIDSVKTNNKITQLQVKWDAIPTATYKWQVSDAANFSNILTDAAKAINDTTASIAIDGKQYAYYYRIIATNADGKVSDTTRGTFADPSLTIPNMAYNGTALSVDNTADIQLKGNDAVTVSTWVKFSAQNNSGYIFTQNSSSAGTSYKSFSIANGVLSIAYSTTATEKLSCPTAMNPNVWNHVAFSQNAGTLTLYVNGTACNSKTLEAASLANTISSSPASIGGNVSLDNFQIWKAALSQSDIVKYAHTEVLGTEPNLAVAYNFNQIDGATIKDVATTTATPASVINSTTVWNTSKAQLTPFVYAASKVNDSSFVAKWSKDAAAKTYTLRYATTADFTAPVLRYTLTDTILSIQNLQSGIKYYLSVRSVFAGDSSEWSAPLVVSTTSLTDSLIAYYPFNGSANNMIGNVAAKTNTASITTDRFGKTNSAYDFTKGYINAGDVNDLDTSFTVAAWINETSASKASVGIVSKFNAISGGFEGYFLSVNENSTEGTVNMTTASSFAYDVTASKYAPQNWNFVCARFTKNTVQLFVNDKLILTKAVNPASVSKNTVADFVIGKFSPANFTNTFQGSIDDIRIYRRPLSDGELSSLYHEGGWPYTGIAMSNTSFKEQQNIGTTVSVLSPIVDKSVTDASTTFSYRLVAGVGSTDNDKFTIANDGKTLLSNYIFDITQQTTASVRIQGTNTETNVSFSYPVSITIIDASITEVYDFESFNANELLSARDTWKGTPSVKVEQLVSPNTKAVSSTEPVDASNLLSNLFKTVKIDDLSAQYVLSYDVSSSDWGTFVGLMYDPLNKGIKYVNDYPTCNVFQFKTSTRSDASAYFFKPDYSSVPLLATQFTGWYRVEVTLSNLNTANATITARAKSLASAGTSWMPILNETTIAIDSTATDKKNPRNWNTFYTHIEGSMGIVDNLSFSKRVKNANRVTTTDGLVLWLKMDNNLLDASGNKHDGVQATGVSAPAYDRFGNANSAYDMKGNSTFHVEGFGGYAPTTEISVSAWAKNNSTYNSSSLFMLLNDNLTYRFNAHLCNSVVFDFGNITGAAPLARVTTISSQSALYQTTNVWNHYVFTSSQKSKSMNIYMNNVLVATKTITTSIKQEAARWLDIASYGYNGVIDDFRVYDRELSATEVARLYYEGGWPVQKITVPSNVLLQPNMSTMLSVTATPSDAKAAPLVYSSNNPAIATIDNTGKITAVKTGVTTITVTTANSSVSATCVVTVVQEAVKASKLALVDSSLDLTVLNNVPTQLKYTYAPKNAILTGIRWMSSNSAVVSVTEKGVISALTPGTAMIYVSDTLSKLKDSCSISVLPSLKPVLVAGQVDTFKLRAVTKVNGVWEAIMPLKITLPVFFKDDDSLTYSYTLVDTLNQSLSGDTLLVSQKTAGVSATKPIVLSLTATDRNAQRTTKFITIKMMSVPDLAPVFKGPALADTMYQFRRTTVVDLSKYIIDDFTPFNRLTYSSPTVSDSRFKTTISGGKLTINLPSSISLIPNKPIVDTVVFMVNDGSQSTLVKVAYHCKLIADSKPVLANLPSIVSSNSDTVIVINLSKCSKDDHTPNNRLVWTLPILPKNINASITDSIITLSSNSSSWTGSESFEIKIADEGGLWSTGTITYDQQGIFVQGPNVSYDLTVYNESLKQYEPLPSIIAKGTKVFAKNTAATGETIDSWYWILDKDTMATSANFDYVFSKTGTYSLTMLADNSSGRTKVVKKDAITVVGIVTPIKTTICKGDTVRLACSNSKYSCVWSYNSSTKISGTEIVIVPTTTTYYKVKITAGSVDVVDSIKITVINTIADVAKDTAVCAGVAYELKPSGFAKLFWKGAATSAISYTTSKTDTIAVSALVDTLGACPAILDTIKVTRLALPVIGLPAKEIVCLGSSKKLVALGGNTINDYKWNKSTVLSDTLIAKEEGTYIVTVTAANGCSTSDTTVVTIDSLPKVIVSANKLVSCKNAVIQLSTKTKVAGLTYNWNVPVTADTTVVLAADGYNDFYVSVTNANGCTGWDSVRVNANTKVSVTITPNKDVTACYGESTDFAATGAESYEWSNGTKTAGITLIAGNGLSNTQKVYVTATKDGCIGIDSAMLTARPRPVVKIDASTDTLCKGDSLQLTASGCKTYSWNGTVANGVKFAVDQSTRYKVTATDEFACQVVDSIFIKVNELTTLKAVASDSSICLGDSIRLYGRGAKSYTWDAQIADSVKFKPTKAELIKYTVTGVDTNSCKATATVEVAVNALPTIQIAKQDSVCKGATTVLTATGTAKTYVWSDAVVNGVSFIPADSKLYKVTATTDNGCVDTSSVNVNVKTSAATNTLTLASRDVTLCKGDSLQLNGEGDFTTIVWNETIADNTWATPLKDSIFTVKATDAQKCVVTDAVKVTVKNRPEVTAHVSASVSCQGRSIKLWATANETVTYSWNETLSASDSSFVLTELGAKEFVVTATNDKQCSDTEKVKVTVNAAVTVDLKAITDTICAGDSVLLDAKGTFAKATWSTGTANGKYVKPTQNTQYNVVVTDNVACESKDSIQVIVHALPNVTANRDTTVCSGRSITLAAKGATKYAWNNDAVDGVAKIITDNTTFTVTGTDENKCSDTAVVKVSVLKPYQEQLGVVTYDSTTSKKVIIAWNRHSEQRTERYAVLRQNGTSLWDTIGRRAFADSALVVDKTADLDVKTFSYKLVTIDSVCHNKAVSNEHRTMHVTSSVTDGVNVTVSWNTYLGLDLASYYVARINPDGKLQYLDTISNNASEMKFTDKHPVNGARYRILYNLPETVSPVLTKSDTGPFSQSFSNMSEASLVSERLVSAFEMNIYPNPASDVMNITLSGNNGATISLFAANGSLVAQTTIANDVAQFDVSRLASGLYSLQVQTDKAAISKSVTISK